MAVDLNARGDADRRGWGSGWSTNRQREMVKIALSPSFGVWVHRDIAPLMALLIEETEKRGYDIKEGQTWGYCCRAIRGSSRASNHSWGIAIDINAPSNGMSDHLVTDMPGWMPKLWNDWGFRWGGDYPKRKDAMHYEFMGTPAQARELAGRWANEGLRQPVPIRGDVTPEFNPPHLLRPIVAEDYPPEGGVQLYADNGDQCAYAGALYTGAQPGRVAAHEPYLLEPITTALPGPDGHGAWLGAVSGAIYDFGVPRVGAPNEHPEFFAGRLLARLLPRGDEAMGFVAHATSGETYAFPV